MNKFVKWAVIILGISFVATFTAAFLMPFGYYLSWLFVVGIITCLAGLGMLVIGLRKRSVRS